MIYYMFFLIFFLSIYILMYACYNYVGDKMIYLDYSATTPVDSEVLDSFNKATMKYIGNPNSLHKLGVEAKKVIDASTEQIKKLLNLTDQEIVYTSGSSESNNLAIKGICEAYPNRGKHIITTELEHSSIYGPINYLVDKGYSVDFVKLNEDGLVDLSDLERLITDDTILVSINAVNSEVGIAQPIDKIADIVKKHKLCFFHCDMTQAIGKIKVSLDNIDLVSFTAHKFFGIKGVGVLVKNKKIKLTPIIHGGKATTIYRSGTPFTGLIVSLAKALRLALNDLDDKYNYVYELNKYVKEELKKYDKVKINSNDFSIPYVLNLSVLGIKPETFQHALEEYEVYISTQTACSMNNSPSKAVMAVTNDIKRATSSIRISLSYKTTKKEVKDFLIYFDKCYRRLTSLNENN